MLSLPFPFNVTLLSISAASRIMRLKREGSGKTKLAMNSTIDHTLWFYDNDFDFADWLLYVVGVLIPKPDSLHDYLHMLQIDCPVAGSGRGVVNGRVCSFTSRDTISTI